MVATDPQRLQGRRRSARSWPSRRRSSRSTGSARSSPSRASTPTAIEADQENYCRREHPRLPQPVHGRRAVADRDLRAGDHALHHGLDHPAAADGRLAVAGEAAEGGRGRPGAHHAVHALPDRRPRGRPGRRLRLPVPLAGQQRRRAGDRELLARRRHPDRRLPHRGLRAADVDGRADHPARHRQRHLADDLRLDRRRPAERRAGLVDEPGPGLQGDHAVRRARRDRRDRVRAGGPAADPDPVRQARDRPPDELAAGRPTCRCA